MTEDHSDFPQISSNLHENLLRAASSQTEKCTFDSCLFISHLTQASALFDKHLAHREGIKHVCPILGNFLLATDSEVREMGIYRSLSSSSDSHRRHRFNCPMASTSNTLMIT
jgi:hypothetical protein